MKKNYILFLLFSLCISGLNATVITVDNNYPSIGNYTSIQAAHDAASNGDTILLTPSQIAYGGVTISKTIHLRGAGFDASNPNIFRAIVSGAIQINNGSNNSVIESIDIAGYRITIDADNITIKRCKIWGIDLLTNHSGTIIIGNEISCSHPNGSINAITVNPNNIVLISNNIIISNSCYTWQNYFATIYLLENVNISIYNNVIWNTFHYYPYCIVSSYNTQSFYNNIILAGLISGLNEPGYNICSGDQLPASNGNIINVDMNAVFVDYQNHNFHLKPGSPALGNGLNGADIGIYSGPESFVDNGYPAIPCIYQLDVPLTGNQQDGINVTIKARTNN